MIARTLSSTIDDIFCGKKEQANDRHVRPRLMIEEGRFAASGADAAAAAYREAGRVVASHVLGYPCETIIIEGNDTGRVDFPKKLIDRIDKRLNGKRRLKTWPRYFVDTAIISCAGAAAALRFRRETGIDDSKPGSASGDSDPIDAMSKSPLTFDLNHSALRDHARRAAEAMMARDDIWAGVDALAKKLPSCGAMPARAVRRVLRDVGL